MARRKAVQEIPLVRTVMLLKFDRVLVQETKKPAK